MSGFDPDWCIRPGETLREWREEHGLGLKSAATCCGRMTPEEFARIEQGKLRISRPIANRLQAGTGIPASLWLNLERIYRAGLKAGKADVSDD